MKMMLYPKLAWEAIGKNKRMYIPYILSGSVMVMMFYILSFLTESPALSNMSGGSVLMSMLPLASGVIAAFSLLFLFYTNSFLIKQRYREFALYNILGMNKKNISKIMLWESLFVTVIAIGAGLFAGIALSKASELVLLNLLSMEVSFELSIGFAALGDTVLIYAGIYLLLFFNSLIKVSRSRPLELMQSSKAGERIPKRVWIDAVIGVLFLGAAYYLAVSIEEPLMALTAFFIAVLLVIGGTYELFMAGSVVFCKLLQKNKEYYYKPNHFVSVSSMMYRMKRNGAGLASICILLTMVLVMISSTASLYFGEENTLKNRYPNGVNITATFDDIQGISDDNLDILRNKIRESSGEEGELTGVRVCEIPGMITEEGIRIQMDESAVISYDYVGYLSILSLTDYNRMTGANETLAEDECLISSERITFPWDTFTMEFGKPYKVKKQLPDFYVEGDTGAWIAPTVYLVVNDIKAFAEPIQDMKNSAGDPMMMYNWRCGFDADTTEAERSAAGSVYGLFKELTLGEESYIHSFSVHSREAQRDSFYDMYGSLFFLGIMLSTVFLMAAVMIIYYKQISEGYEDQARFEIMQKVGMTKQDIKKSINSQMLTVFFLPLMFAGIHLAFAFPVISKLLLLFGFNYTMLNIIVNLVCFAVFGLFYALVYKITSNSYYSIVSGRQ